MSWSSVENALSSRFKLLQTIIVHLGIYMIKTRNDLKKYLEEDRLAQPLQGGHGFING